jgi:hypothetical protein
MIAMMALVLMLGACPSNAPAWASDAAAAFVDYSDSSQGPSGGEVGTQVGADTAVPRIVNGLTTQGRPTTAAILFGPARRALCTGVLIGCQTVLTAAHCVCANGRASTCGTPDPSNVAVYLQHGGIVGVAAIDVHPAYAFAEAGDLAVLTLAAPMWGVAPTPINATATPAVGTAGAIAGFGISGGPAGGGGLKREGAVVTAGCAGEVPEPAHVCWSFAEPIGSPGTDSNTCAGDSGGPLFVDLGAGEVVAGITSGGSAGNCMPPDVSFDANVFENRDFIESVAGADLASATCGPVSHVGDPDTAVVTVEFASLSRAEAGCRAHLRKRYASYVVRALTLARRCLDGVNAGLLSGPCPDAGTALALVEAREHLDPLRIERKCPAEVVAAIRTAAGCAGARDAAELAACLVAAADAVGATLLDVAYADAEPSGTLPAAEHRCQAGIATTLSRYVTTRLTVLAGCQARQDRGRVTSCPDGASASRLSPLARTVAPGIERRCSDALVAGLAGRDPFGGGCATAVTAADLAACATAEHDNAVATLLGVLQEVASSDRASVTVPGGSERLRVTLNGVEAGANDIDLYIRLGTPPSPTDFDARSSASGVFEAIEMTQPAAGTWHVLVHTFSGRSVPFQLTITTLQP